jgi:hypothetical protein
MTTKSQLSNGRGGTINMGLVAVGKASLQNIRNRNVQYKDEIQSTMLTLIGCLAKTFNVVYYNTMIDHVMADKLESFLSLFDSTRPNLVIYGFYDRQECRDQLYSTLLFSSFQ